MRRTDEQISIKIDIFLTLVRSMWMLENIKTCHNLSTIFSDPTLLQRSGWPMDFIALVILLK